MHQCTKRHVIPRVWGLKVDTKSFFWGKLNNHSILKRCLKISWVVTLIGCSCHHYSEYLAPPCYMGPVWAGNSFQVKRWGVWNADSTGLEAGPHLLLQPLHLTISAQRCGHLRMTVTCPLGSTVGHSGAIEHWFNCWHKPQNTSCRKLWLPV